MTTLRSFYEKIKLQFGNECTVFLSHLKNLELFCFCGCKTYVHHPLIQTTLTRKTFVTYVFLPGIAPGRIAPGGTVTADLNSHEYLQKHQISTFLEFLQCVGWYIFNVTRINSKLSSKALPVRYVKC